MKSLQIDDLSFSYVDEGEGRPIVFLHGFPLDHSMWNGQIESFANTHRVIALDLRGHGQTTVTEGKVTMAEMADDVAKLLSAIDVTEPVTLCGLSMGGYVAWEFWKRHSSQLARLILCDTRAVGDTEEVARGRQMMAAQVVQADSKMAADSMVPKLFGASTYESQSDKVEAVRQVILATDPIGIAATQRGMAERVDMTATLGEVKVPALVLCGAEDKISPAAEMKGFAEAMPNAIFVEIADAGHLAPLEQPAATNEAIRSFIG